MLVSMLCSVELTVCAVVQWVAVLALSFPVIAIDELLKFYARTFIKSIEPCCAVICLATHACMSVCHAAPVHKTKQD